ncbi:redoxin family protein [Tellurirhabdus bombi]|uniref:redoxin family protein n=1 Tax=Tellurirhabdus bombi TaxID=2907205 RepID=UPI001F2458DE|nr:redoxin family protein [Tellurirhabdus bombi]
MKQLTFVLLFLAHAGLAQQKKGQAVPDLQFETILNAPVKATALSQLKGKIVLIEFWATWCGSCLEAMPHLKQLQQKYGSQLQVIAVTNETVKRTNQYLAARPSNLWFAVDTAGAIAKLFPHQLIPHTVLIDTEGKLIASTNPEAVTDQVIEAIWNRKEVHLPQKIDNPLPPAEVLKTYFYAADTVQSRFRMQGEIKGSPGLSTTYLNDSTFKQRRITCLNLPLTSLYRLAHGDFPYSRTIDKTGEGNNAPVYCLDLIVRGKDELLPTLQTELAKRFDMQTKVEPQLKDVSVLKIMDPEKFKRIPRNKSGQRTYYARHGEIDQQGITMNEFAEFLESFGTGKRLVINGTQNSEKLDVKFSFQPENPQSLVDILAGMGLALVNEQREVAMLVLYKE